MGEENYKKVKPYLGMSAYYVYKGKNYTRFMFSQTNYGLFGNERRGFTSISYKGVGLGSSLHYFINGKFIRSDEKYEGEKYQ
ncbi:hypothetical protein [Campylobacter taeniopygiae]|uniref:hypothetical protein n=1 Tax=Campylobacter taeniopygiae TaxID=2510188 RepID=UPI003D6A8E31